MALNPTPRWSWIRPVLALGLGTGAAIWWYIDACDQVRYDHQVAARLCYKRYDTAAPGADFIRDAEAVVDACYEALLAGYTSNIASVPWIDAVAVGLIAAVAVWGATGFARRWLGRRSPCPSP